MTTDLAGRVHALDWEALSEALDDRGFAITPPVLSLAECEGLAALFDW